MATTTAKAVQFEFALPDRAGLLAEVSAALTAAKVNMLSICAYAMQGTAQFMLTVDSPAKARRALSGMGVTAKETPVLAVTMANKPGELGKVAQKLADAGVGIQELYGSTSAGARACCIFKLADVAKAARLVAK
jgi:hypothetical protein